MEKHTKEPWINYGSMTHRCNSIEISMDDYDRARACVNACAGLPTETLESAQGYKAAIDGFHEQRALLAHARNERDQLLAALYMALPFVEDHEGIDVYKPDAVSKVVKTIRAAIAAVEQQCNPAA